MTSRQPANNISANDIRTGTDNGKPRGKPVKMVGEPVTLSTGITVYARKVSPYSRQAVMQSVPKPKPPLVEVDYGEDKKGMEPNEADPDYQAALEEYTSAVAVKSGDAMLRLGVMVEIDYDVLNALRMDFESLGMEMDADDKLAYLKHVAIGSEEDLTLLGAVITSQSQPTEEAVQAHADSFSGDVEGQARAVGASSEIPAAA